MKSSETVVAHILAKNYTGGRDSAPGSWPGAQSVQSLLLSEEVTTGETSSLTPFSISQKAASQRIQKKKKKNLLIAEILYNQTSFTRYCSGAVLSCSLLSDV